MNIKLTIEYIDKEVYFRDIYLFIKRIKNKRYTRLIKKIEILLILLLINYIFKIK